MACILSPNNKRRRESDNFGSLSSHHVFPDMETKSIADLLTQRVMENPYEVVRKPPKKKKKDEPLACFDNEALNLNTPEKQFNPFEVKRSECEMPVQAVSYVNLGLNLKAPESASVKNPFEIVRSGDEESPRDPQEGIENPAMDLPCPLAIAVPFTPSVNRRIAFHDAKTPPNSMTPSEMLSKTLRFTPETTNATPRRSLRKNLSTISEEALNIDDELDCYQLELENSINEAKSVNRKYFSDLRKGVVKKEAVKVHHLSTEPDVVYEGDENSEENPSTEDDFAFRNPQPFQRAYRRPGQLVSTKGSTKESTDTKSSIRRSIRKLASIAKIPKKSTDENQENPSEENPVKSERVTGNKLMASIRQSLRRKRKIPQEQQIIQQEILNSTIIENDNRRVFREIQEPANPFGRRNSLRRSTRQVLKNVFKKNVEGYELGIATN
ncbi:uncharacterized protein LOC129805299 [Phlebotomus papatasi]|uniref:uncharacterized protein LOC129805299 n=1 Tax=Phlebotomus papatasi TaxID=29031 RepID=UPI002483526A|nr:uncharacterized protein LOC129805299 [Phlebotomus papatasi]